MASWSTIAAAATGSTSASADDVGTPHRSKRALRKRQGGRTRGIQSATTTHNSSPASHAASAGAATRYATPTNPARNARPAWHGWQGCHGWPLELQRARSARPCRRAAGKCRQSDERRPHPASRRHLPAVARSTNNLTAGNSSSWSTDKSPASSGNARGLSQ